MAIGGARQVWDAYLGLKYWTWVIGWETGSSGVKTLLWGKSECVWERLTRSKLWDSSHR